MRYTYVDDAEALDAHRPEHRAFLAELSGDAEVVLSGPLAPGVGQPSAALLLVRAESAQAVEDALAADPFRTHDLLESVEVRGWNPVLGAWHERLAADL